MAGPFGQKQPPLYVSIQKILNKYPDGQIFKVKYIVTCIKAKTSEMPWFGVVTWSLCMSDILLSQEIIQNADDAGATAVHFYLDSRQHGTDYLVEPKLATFQGPSLLAYNDAVFTDDDWQSIQNMQQSSKVKDTFKVGKFGIGFNSVYHITGTCCSSFSAGECRIIILFMGMGNIVHVTSRNWDSFDMMGGWHH